MAADELRLQIEEMPRVRFACERDWMVGPNNFVIGFLWDRNFDAQPGEFVYRKRFLLRLKFRVWIDRWK